MNATDFIDRDRLEQVLALDKVIRYYTLKGMQDDLERLITFGAGNYVRIGDLQGKAACEAYLDNADQAGFTPLHIAVTQGFDDIVELFIRAGADLNKETLGGETALYLAVSAGEKRTAKLLGDAGGQYEFSQGAGTIFRNNIGTRAHMFPTDAAAKVVASADGQGPVTVIKSRMYKDVKPFELRNPTGRSPYHPDSLNPQGVAVAQFSRDFVAGAAARFKHPGDARKSQWASAERRMGTKTKTSGAKWEVYAQINKGIVGDKAPSYMDRWIEEKDMHARSGHQPDWIKQRREKAGHSITGMRYRGAADLHAQKPHARTKADGSSTDVKINPQRLLKKVLVDAHYQQLSGPYQHLVDSMKFRPTMNIMQDGKSDKYFSMGSVSANFGF